MIKKLIVNADDFGMTQGNTIATLLAHKQGILTSTTCMTNMPFAKFALEEAKKYPDLGVGVHLVLTYGRPLVAGAKSYTDENGNFIRPKDYPDGNPHADLDELYAEWKAQIEKFIEITGHKPTHIDSHHGAHLLPGHVEISKRLSQEYGIPMRQKLEVVPGYDYEYTRGDSCMYGGENLYEVVTQAMENHDGILEIITHPALVDQRLYETSSYSLPRMKELAFLLSPEFKQYIEDHNIELINFSNVTKPNK